MCISFSNLVCCSSVDKADKQQIAQNKILDTKNNLGTFTAFPLQKELSAYTESGAVDKKQLATVASVNKMFDEVDPLFSRKGTIKITPYKTIDASLIVDIDNDSISSEVKIIKNQISPTCFRTLKDEDSTNLENIYAATNDAGFIAGRTGIIDTPKKAKQFDAIVQDQLEQWPQNDRIARVVSHQLNSPESEGTMIENQHREMARLNTENKQYKVAHLNTPSNVLYDYTLYIRKIPLIGGFLSALIEGIFLYGERESKEQNLEGLARMAVWLKEDLQDTFYIMSDLLPNLKTIGMDDVILQIDQAVHTNSKEELKNSRSLIKTSLLQYYEDLKNLNLKLQANIGEGYELKEVQEKVALMQMILGDQLDIEGQALDRGCLNMAIELLNTRLGVLSFINCKSGLDRTGYLFAVKTAMAAMEEEGENLFDMVLNWSEYTSEINILAKLKAEGRLLAFSGDLDEKILKHISSFRMKVFENLRTHGLDATAMSTGVFGFKWSTSFWEANRIPLNFLPPTVEMTDEQSEQIEVRLVNYNSDGKATGLTPQGEAFLIKDSKKRGA